MVSCPTEFGRGVIPYKVGIQLTQLSRNCALHQHVVHHNYISCQKKTTFVGTHDWTFFRNKLLTVTWISVWSLLSAQVWKPLSALPPTSLLGIFFKVALPLQMSIIWFLQMSSSFSKGNRITMDHMLMYNRVY